MWQLLTDGLRWLGQHWLLALPLALGFVAVWWLLPQPRRRDWRPAVAVGAAALLIGAFALLESTGRAVDYLFYVFAGLAVVAGGCMITQRSPVYAALWFALVILSTCGLFLLQSAPFLAAATVIVYAGAIIVTFLFVIMLAQQTGVADYDRRAREPLLACLAGFVLLTALLYVLQVTYSDKTRDASDSKPRQARGRLEKLRELIAAQAPRSAIEEVMYLEPQVPLGEVLREEVLKRQPAPKTRVEAVDRLLTQLGAARQTDDRAAMGRIVDELLTLAEASDAAEVRGIVPVPTEVALRQSPLSYAKAPHVTALGTSLFGDYLWAVELAGTLLLVATIGAIAIAQRGRDKGTRGQGDKETSNGSGTS